ncbi:acyl-CoA dehydrogenase family protein [Endozoicomonas ascidiicola]|uniref:acyl-CoA dehydrogenase family protein n=1 Tax=Endozoicomonas ascidiicola TaxID=1698521 RepID=UPI00083750BD|nr:acyl-CoA dehydrogenase family protein [Endozoicomonas ascidiicola]
MEFAFTEEQAMIRESAAGYLQNISTSAGVRRVMSTEQGYDSEVWSGLCRDMYWQALHIPEAYGGLGLGYVELAIILEEMGKRLFCSPFFSTVALGVNALLVVASEEQKQRWLPEIAEGRSTVSLGFISSEDIQANRQWGSASVQAHARKEGDGYVLSGSWHYVPDGHTANVLILAAREKGVSTENGIRLFVIAGDQEGVNRQWTPTMDQTRKLARVDVDGLFVSADCCLGGEESAGWPTLEKVLQLSSIASAAEQLGGARQVMDLTIDYTQERVQFNRPIASFQAIKHRAADMMLQVECATSAVYYAACVADEYLSERSSTVGDSSKISDELLQAASLAKAYCSDTFFHCAAESIQLHGGVGFTWEYDPHLYFKRARSSEQFLGAGDLHRERIASQLLDSSAARSDV